MLQWFKNLCTIQNKGQIFPIKPPAYIIQAEPLFEVVQLIYSINWKLYKPCIVDFQCRQEKLKALVQICKTSCTNWEKAV